jgi:sterol 14-demethylase
MFHFGDNHRNPEIYREPEKWDPARYEKGREEDKSVPYAWVGWGGGRHPCCELRFAFSSHYYFPVKTVFLEFFLLIVIVGMRFAKLEQYLITAFFTAMFDYDLTDKTGNPTPPPKIDTNTLGAMKPKEKVYLKYKLRE